MPRQPRLLTIIVLACALALRVTVPTGWMPSATGGVFAIELCSAAAPGVHGGPTSHHGSQGTGQHSGDCSFAPFQAGFAASAQAPSITAPLPAVRMSPQHVAAPFFATGPPALPPPARGPPAIA